MYINKKNKQSFYQKGVRTANAQMSRKNRDTRLVLRRSHDHLKRKIMKIARNK